MYEIRRSKRFRISLKKYLRSKSFDQKEAQFVINELVAGRKLAEKYKDHQLVGKLYEYRECHIKSNLLLMYKIEEGFLILANLGSHPELFG